LIQIYVPFDNKTVTFLYEDCKLN